MTRARALYCLISCWQSGSTVTSRDEIQLLWLQLEQQEHQISVAVVQAELLRQQVGIETQARNDAEVRIG